MAMIHLGCVVSIEAKDNNCTIIKGIAAYFILVSEHDKIKSLIHRSTNRNVLPKIEIGDCIVYTMDGEEKTVLEVAVQSNLNDEIFTRMMLLLVDKDIKLH